MIKDLKLILETDICFCIHPFKRAEGKLPFTMISCIRGKRQYDYIFFLNHERKEFYIVPNFSVSEYRWVNNDQHCLYFVAGVDKIYTVLHENISQGLIKVPCCYENPDYFFKGDLKNNYLRIKDFLLDNDWALHVAQKIDNNILNLIKEKIDTTGVSGGKYLKR